MTLLLLAVILSLFVTLRKVVAWRQTELISSFFQDMGIDLSLLGVDTANSTEGLTDSLGGSTPNPVWNGTTPGWAGAG